MKIVCKANKIYMRFTSNSKTIEKSLKMDVCEKNLKFVNDVLLPIFEKIRCERKIKTKKILYSGAKNIKKFDIKTHKIIRNPHTLGDFCTIVFDKISQNRKISTIKTAENAINRFFDFINDKKIADYKIYELQEIVTQMQKNLAASSIKTIFCYIKQAFNEALKNDIITKNPVNFVIFPKIVREKKEILTLDDVVKIFDNAGGELKNFGNRIFYGTRSGEILGLCADDFDFKNHKIIINKNQTRFGLTTPKNGKNRIIPLAKNLALFLKFDKSSIFKKYCDEKFRSKHDNASVSGDNKINFDNKIFDFKNNDDFYVSHFDGDFYCLTEKYDFDKKPLFTKDYFALRYEFDALLKHLGLKKYTFHTFRHTFASLLIENDVNPTFVAEILGHSNLNMLEKVYAHSIVSAKNLQKLNKALNF